MPTFDGDRKKVSGAAFLLFSFDDVKKEEPLQIGVCQPSKVPEREADKVTQNAEMFELSDVINKYKRVPFPINGSVFDIYLYSANSSFRKRMKYFGNDPKLNVVNERNSVMIDFQTRSNVHGLFNAVAIDALEAIANVNMRFESIQPRVTFISGAMVIFDAYMLGLERRHVPGTDLEYITLHLEKAVGDQEKPVADEKKIEKEHVFKDETAGIDYEGSKAAFESLCAQSAKKLRMPFGEKAEHWQGFTYHTEAWRLPDGYTWYLIDSEFNIHSRNAPRFDHVRNVARKPVEIRTYQVPHKGVIRCGITLVYDKQILALNWMPKQIGQYCATTYKGKVYLGIAKEKIQWQGKNYTQLLAESYQLYVDTCKQNQPVSAHARAIRARQFRGVWPK